MSAFQKIVRVGRSVLGGAALGLCWGSATLGLGPEWTWAVELPEARLRVLNPPGGRPGETVVVEVQGVDLEEGTLRFTHPGIESAADAKDPKKMAVKIGEGVPEGVYEARVVGRYGVSNSRRFEVSRLATTPLDPKAIAMEQAQAWSLPGVIQGAVPSQSVCWFRVEAQAGRELVFDCRAAAMDSKLDPVLVLSDAGGRELVRVRDRVLRFTPKDSGPLFLSLRDFLSGGGPEFFFRLVGGSASEVAVRPVETPLVFWPVSGAARKEQEPNDERKPERVSLPLEVRGEFGPGRDVDGYEFEGKKGEVWWLEVTSNRLGYASDPRLVVQRVMRDKDGKETLQDVLEARKASLFEGDPDFNGENRDPVGRLEVKEDGVFRATLRDGYAGSAGGEARPYTLAIRKPAPDFALVCAAHPPMANRAYLRAPGINPAFMVDVRGVNLRPGQGVPVRVLLVRRDGFEGEVRVEAEGLPAGVTAEPCVVGPGKKEGILVLRAGREAKRWSGAIRIYGMASVEGQERRREAVGSTPLWDSEMYPKGDWIRNARCRPMGEFTLGVMEDAPWTTALRVEPAQLEALPTDKVSLTVHADRDGVEGGALKLRVVGFEGLEKAAEVVLADKAASVAYPWDLAPLKLAPGRYTVWFQGDEKAKREVRGKPGEVDLKLASNAVTLVIRDPAAKPAASVPAPALAPVSFVKEILPMLEASCLPCHNATKAEGGLVLETPQAMREGGDSGPAIVPNKALSSLLYETAAHQKKPFMPPNANKAKAAPWTEAQLALVKRWIDEGATGTGKLRQPVAWKPMPEAVRALSAAAVDAQGRWVAAGQGGRVFFYDVALRRPAGFVEAHPDVVSSAAFSPDGSMLATGSRGEVKLWKNGSGGVPAFPLEGVVGVAVSGSGSVASGTLRHSDGQTVVVAMHGQPTRIKRPGKVPEVVELGGTPEGVQAKALVAERMAGARFEVQFLEAEGKGLSDKLAKAKTDWEKLRKEHESLELKKGDREKALAEAVQKRETAMGARDGAEDAVMRTDAKVEAAKRSEEEAGREVKARESEAQSAVAEEKEERAKRLEGSRALAKGAAEQRQSLETELKKAKADAAAREAAYRDAAKALQEAEGLISTARTVEINLRNLEEGIAQTEKSAVASAAALVAARERLGALEKEAAEVDRQIAETRLPEVEAMALAQGGTVLWTRHAGGGVRAWSVEGGRPLALDQMQVRWEWVRTLGDARKLDSPFTGRVNAVAFSPDGKSLATGSGDPSRSGEVKIWNVASGALEREISKPHKDAVLALDYSRDGLYLASGSADRAARIWEVKSGKLFRNMEAHASHVLSVAFRGDFRRLASAGADNAVKIWDLQSSDVLTTFSSFSKEVSFLKYCGGGDELVAASAMPALKVLKDAGGEVRGKTEGLSKYVVSAAASPDGNLCVLGEVGGTLRMVNREGKPLVEWKVGEAQAAPVARGGATTPHPPSASASPSPSLAQP